ncbi:MAG: SpoIIE family protein phosphatase [Bacteroidia bacterium]|nr:SpoIIE family protein phosphatase [Bacteroidia bacterium]MDW8089043.1 SpoIIE family protein phosphatase [Bacteroidia bacterium]
MRRRLRRLGLLVLGLIGGIVLVVVIVLGHVIGHVTIEVIRLTASSYQEPYEPVERTQLPARLLRSVPFSPPVPLAVRLRLPASARVLPVESLSTLRRLPISCIHQKGKLQIEAHVQPLATRVPVGKIELAQVNFVSYRVTEDKALLKLWSWRGREFDKLTVGRAGDIWASHSEWIMRWDGSRLEEIPLPEGISKGFAPTLVEDTCGIWAIWTDTILFYDGFYWYGKKAALPLTHILKAPSGGFLGAPGWGSKVLWYSCDSLYALEFVGLTVLPAGWIRGRLIALCEHNQSQGLLLWEPPHLRLLLAERDLWRERNSIRIGEGREKVVFTSDKGTFLYEEDGLYYVGPPPPLEVQSLVITRGDRILAANPTARASLDPSGKWHKEVAPTMRRNLFCLGLHGEAWTLREFDGERLVGVLHDGLAEPISLPFQDRITAFYGGPDTLWVLTASGQVWFSNGSVWKGYKLPYPISQADLSWDAAEQSLWITGAHPLLRWRAESWEIFGIDSVERVLRDTQGTLWLLRCGKVYRESKPVELPLPPVRYIGQGEGEFIWIVTDSAVYGLAKNGLWEIDKGSYFPLGTDSKGRLWAEPKSAKGKKVIGWKIHFFHNTPYKAELFSIGPNQGLQGTLYAIGGGDTLWWQGQESRLIGLCAAQLKEGKGKFLAGLLTFTYDKQATYSYLWVPFPVQRVARGHWRGRGGLFTLSSEGLYFHPKGQISPLLPPRLRVRWRENVLPIISKIAANLKNEVELGTTIPSSHDRDTTLDWRGGFLERRGKWPDITMVPFTISYFSRDITFTFAPRGLLLEAPQVEYQYRLLGESALWSRISSEGKAFFYQLSEGDYTLEVRMRSQGGTWSEPARWRFRVSPPPWRTLVAYVLYGVLIVGGVVGYIRYRLAALRRRAAELQAEVEKATVTIRTQNEALQAANAELTAQRDLIEAQRQDLIDSLMYAQRIQRALLPSTALLSRVFPESFVLFLPRDIVSGDMYWFYSPTGGDSELLFLAADCTGHGVPGAFMSLLTLSLLERSAKEALEMPPGALLDLLSAQIIRLLNPEASEEIKDGFEGVLCRFRRRAGRWLIEYAAARRSFWLVREREIIELFKDPLPVGLSEIPALRGKSFNTYSMELQAGDWLYFSTDGFTDQLGGPEGRRFGIKRFRSLLLEVSALPADAQRTQLHQAFEEWRAVRDIAQVDDVLLIGLRVPE